MGRSEPLTARTSSAGTTHSRGEPRLLLTFISKYWRWEWPLPSQSPADGDRGDQSKETTDANYRLNASLKARPVTRSRGMPPSLSAFERWPSRPYSRRIDARIADPRVSS